MNANGFSPQNDAGLKRISIPAKLQSLAIGLYLCLTLVCSYSAQNSIRPNLPPETSFNESAGRGDPILITLTLETGEKLLFFVDTGCPYTVLDKSLEPKLGKRLRTGKVAWEFSGKQSAGIYKAPKLYLGRTQLVTGSRVKTEELGDDYRGTPIAGFLGMDCLRHYCIQLDFAADKMRFFDPDHLDVRELGKAVPLSMYFGGVFVDPDILDAKKLFCRLDIGLYGCIDVLLKPKLLQWELREQKPFGQWQVSTNRGDTLYSKSGLQGQIYTNFVLVTPGVQLADRPVKAAMFTRTEFNGECYTNLLFAESYSASWPAENVITLQFIARNLVTFNFPKRIMYLKHETDERLRRNNFTITPDAMISNVSCSTNGLVKIP